jgi:hypothetical protein
MAGQFKLWRSRNSQQNWEYRVTRGLDPRVRIDEILRRRWMRRSSLCMTTETQIAVKHG